MKDYSLEANRILTEYIAIHDEVFNAKGSIFAKIFKPVNFEEKWLRMQKLISDINQLIAKVYSTETKDTDYKELLHGYLTSLGNAMFTFAHILSNLDFKAKGTRPYGASTYAEDLEKYEVICKSYQDEGSKLQAAFKNKFQNE